MINQIIEKKIQPLLTKVQAIKLGKEKNDLTKCSIRSYTEGKLNIRSIILPQSLMRFNAGGNSEVSLRLQLSLILAEAESVNDQEIFSSAFLLRDYFRTISTMGP
jgi:hypothetical protein